MKLFSVVIAALALSGLVGCGNANVERMATDGGIAWEEQAALFSVEQMGGLEMAIGYNDVAAAMQHVNSQGFQQAVTAFKNSEMPGGISDRTAQRDELVAALDAMTAAASAGNAEEFKTALENAKQANQALMATE